MSRGGASGGTGLGLQWKVGLVSAQGKYLTAESFGFKINASATTLRKKQQWTIEQDPNEDETVYFRSHLGRYLSGDKKGNASCDAEKRGDFEKFVIYYAGDGSGRWAIANLATGYYFGGAPEDQVQCQEKQPGASDWWFVHLAIHPQLNLRNVNRSKYARLDAESSRLQVTEVIPWGEDALITIEYFDGRYCVRSCDNRYLSRDGTLVDQPNEDTLFTLEIKSGQHSGMALRDSQGKYLTAVGRDAVMQARNKTVGKDELFTIEDSQPQVFVLAHNGKMASIKQGIDVTANRDELTDKETFQVEFDKKTDQWRIRTSENTFWSLESGGIQAVGKGQSPNEQFIVDWQDDGSVAIKASNGRYLTAKMNGSLQATSDSLTDKEKFFVTIINRPILVLKCEFGFVGWRTSTNPRYECNKTTYSVILVEHAKGKSAAYYFKGHNGKYWSVDATGNLNADQSAPQPFFIELRGHSKMAIKAPNGNYIKGEQNGIMSALSNDLKKATLWEY